MKDFNFFVLITNLFENCLKFGFITKNQILIISLLSSTLFLNAQEFQHFELKSSLEQIRIKIDIDLDRDGYLDHLVSNHADNKIVWLKNYNDQYFREKELLSLTDKIISLNAFDADKDSIFEIYVVTQKDTWVYRFNEIIQLPTKVLPSFSPNEIVKKNIQADFDADGYDDIVSMGKSSYVHINYNKNGIFEDRKLYQTITDHSFKSYDVVDYDKDGLLDIVYLTNYNSLGYLKNKGNKLFENKIIRTFTENYEDFKIIDFDNDGFLDMVFSENVTPTNSSKVSEIQLIVRYSKDGFNQSTILTPVLNTVGSYLLQDLDDDGDLDIFVSHTLIIKTNPGFKFLNEQIELYIQDNANEFKRKILYNGATITCSNATVIHSKIGEKIIAFLAGSKKALYYLKNFLTEPNLDRKTTSYLQGESDFQMADINDDGLEDIVSTNKATLSKYPLKYYINNGNYQFEELKVKSDTTYKLFRIYDISDWNNDDKKDIIGYDSHNLILFYNVGQDSVNAVKLLNNIHIHGFNIFDSDNDGDLDILIYSDNIHFSNDKSYHITLLENIGSGIFNARDVNTKIQANHIEILDLNNDGLLDFYSSEAKDYVPFGQTNPSRMYRYINLGDNQFQRELYSDIACAFFKVSDVDNDGDLDLIGIQMGYRILNYYEKRQNGFTTHKITDLAYGSNPNFKIFDEFDLNNDGFKDFVIYGQGTYALLNFGNSQFKFKGLLPTVNFYSELNLGAPVYVHDFNKDGDMDIVRINHNGFIEFYTNLDDKFQVFITGFIDKNDNKTKDLDEIAYGDFLLKSSISSDFLSHKIQDGYITFLAQGEHKFIYNKAYNPFYINTSFDTIHINTDLIATKLDSIFIPLKPVLDTVVVNTSISSTILRCNQTGILFIDLFNSGTENISGWLNIELDKIIQTYSLLQSPDTSLVDNKFGWKINELQPGRKLEKQIQVKVPRITSANQVGNEFIFKANFIASENQEVTGQSEVVYKTVLRCSYDPNDKLVSPNNPNNEILKGQDLVYTIRFQNTGNDTAFNVTIYDKLHEALDLNTLRILSSSHQPNLSLSIRSDRQLKFNFDNIYLPDSLTNPIQSQGFVTFVVTPKYNFMQIGDSITNSAEIIFDQNPPILTNTTKSVYETFISYLINSSLELSNLIIYPNPTSQNIHINTKEEYSINQIKIYNVDGKLVIKKELNISNEHVIDLSALPPGIYFVNLVSSEHLIKPIKIIKQ